MSQSLQVQYMNPQFSTLQTKSLNITEPTSANPSTDAGAGAEGTALDLDEGNWRFGIRCRYP